MSERFNISDLLVCVMVLALIGIMLVLFRDVFSGFKEVSETINAMVIAYTFATVLLILTIIKLFLR